MKKDIRTKILEPRWVFLLGIIFAVFYTSGKFWLYPILHEALNPSFPSQSGVEPIDIAIVLLSYVLILGLSIMFALAAIRWAKHLVDKEK